MAYKSGDLEIPLTGALLFAGAEIASVANPEGCPLIIVDAKLIVDTPSTGAANISVGIGASASTSYNTLVNALAINGAITGVAYHAMTALAANGAALLWPAASFLTATGSASTVGFTGRLFLRYIKTA